MLVPGSEEGCCGLLLGSWAGVPGVGVSKTVAVCHKDGVQAFVVRNRRRLLLGSWAGVPGAKEI